METKEITKQTHHGHAIKRLRRTLGIKQEALAMEIGMCQQTVSTYESKKEIEDDMLEKFAKALNVSPQLIRELEEDPLTIIIENNTFENGSSNIGYVDGDNVINNNPLEKILELSSEKQALLERMLEMEKEKSALLEKLLREGK